MNPFLTLAPIAAAAAITLAPAAGATDTTDTCIVTAQPQDERSYKLDYVDSDGTAHVLIGVQNAHVRLTPTDFEIPADFKVVRWAAGNPNSDDGYFDHLYNGGGCEFTEPYHEAPGWRKSIVIRVGFTLPPATVAPVPSTTTAKPPATTAVTEMPPATSVTSTPETPTTVTWIDPMPPQPGTEPPVTQPTVDVALTPDPTPYTAVPRLPETGADTRTLAGIGGLAVFVGLLIAAFTPVRRAMPKHVSTRNPESE